MSEFIDLKALAKIKCDKLLVEFFRVNGWMQKWFDIAYSAYTVSYSGYKHLPLEMKKALIKSIKGSKESIVCEDEDEAYEY